VIKVTSDVKDNGDEKTNSVLSSIKDVLVYLETPNESRAEEKSLKLFDNVKAEIYNKYKDKITEEQAEKLTIAMFQVLIDMNKAE